ncbi:sigma-70 family RNA polymerase sigma factor [Actinospica durhamensis]|uniref:Sigma-70 family RNA polymerase sigma factor n=1 Tax=Actinospica durhamensis TaxID=1508375 RepID=A0A941ITE7_9ACTN|nr:sigma-70 family RNA polymerase sigma factor [Actinospica durhamensis]MBR7837537.1 sigma-70 family RNA polymerase sigma factor [Actinospica durhamensis]
MEQSAALTDRFEAQRPRLRALAYRMLGSGAEAEDAVQEAWLRLAATHEPIESLEAWLTTVVTRLCLNLLRTRHTRREEPLEQSDAAEVPVDAGSDASRLAPDPEHEAELAEEVGLALLVVLDALSPAERVAFVLHDLFEVPFDDMAPMMERSTAAVRQLASRARRRVRGVPAPTADPARARRAVEAYLSATRAGDFEALLTLLDPDVVLYADERVVPTPKPLTLHGALTVARSAMGAVDRAAVTVLALVEGAPALVMAPFGRLAVVMRFTVGAGGIREIDVIADPARLRTLDVALLEG